MTKFRTQADFYNQQEQEYNKSDFKKRIDEVNANLKLVSTKEELLDLFAFAVEEREKNKNLQDIIATEIFYLVNKLREKNVQFQRADLLWDITLRFAYLDHLTNMPRELAPFDDQEFQKRHDNTEHEWQLLKKVVIKEKSRKAES